MRAQPMLACSSKRAFTSTSTTTCLPARAGKQVVVLVEVKARFDEQANIGWARMLERAGCHVVYGLVGLKTHCKTALVVRQEGGYLRRYCHIGTGNYHPKTARMYEDFGLLTADAEVGADLTDLFNVLTGYSRQTGYRRLLVAPHGVRSGLIERIERETVGGAEGLIQLTLHPATLARGVEPLVEVPDPAAQADRARVFDLAMSDESGGFDLHGDGTWH